MLRGHSRILAQAVVTYIWWMRIVVDSFDSASALVLFHSPAGTVAGRWMNDRDPEVGEHFDVEFTTEPDCVWELDVTDASPDEPDAIVQAEDAYELVGRVEAPILPEDVPDGAFCMRIAGSLHLVGVKGLPADAGGRRVRVRQKTLNVYPHGGPYRS
jgi:hypothetical protein